MPDVASGAVDQATPERDRSRRQLADGREFTIVKVYRAPADLAATLAAAGFEDVQVTTSGRFFLLTTATVPPAPD
jgi:hypothetical protein